MNTPSIYEFSSVADFLKVLSSQHKVGQHGKALTAEGWARELSYSSAQTVSMVMSGRRAPSVGLVLRLGRHLGFEAREQRYLELMGELERRTRSGQGLDDVVDEMREINPDFGLRQPIDAARFAYIADWFYFPIKQLASTPGFQEDPKWIQKRLGGKASIKEIEGALDTLLRLGVFRRDPTSKRIISENQGLQSTTDVPSSALKSHHRQMMERAIESLEEQDVGEREITSLTFRFGRQRMGEAKQAIRKFRDWFDSEFEDRNASDAFQLNIQLFSHTTVEEKQND